MSELDKIVSICHKIYQKGYVSAYDGNVSVITDKNTVLFTRSGVCKGDVTKDDILEFDMSGSLLKGEGRITTEFKLHLFAYSRRTDATAFSLVGEGLTEHYFPEMILTLGKVPLCKYGTPSTNDLPLSLEPYIEHSWAYLLQNHGALTLGKNLDDAYYKMEKLEHSAETIFKAKMIGKPEALSREDITKLLKISEETYGIKIDPRNIY